MSSHAELSGNRWDDLYFAPDHPDADTWRAEIADEMAGGYPDDLWRAVAATPNLSLSAQCPVLMAQIDQGGSR